MKTVLFANRNAGVECLEHLIEINEKPIAVVTSDTDDESIFHSVREAAQRYRIPTFVSNPSGNTVYSFMKAVNADALFSIYYNRKIPKKVLDTVGIGINFHGGRLPDYKGCNSNLWSIINGELYTDSTAHILTPKFDEGDIVDVETVQIDEDETGKSLYFKVSEATVNLFKRVYYATKINELERTPQKAGGNYYDKTLPFNGIISDTEPPEKIKRFMRAMYFPPFPEGKISRK